MDEKKVFKQCPNCLTVWKSREDFLKDSSLELNGYKPDFKILECGLFFFTHKVDNCFSTMALESQDFLDLYDGTVYPDRKTGGPECPRYCLDQKQLSRCDALCECAFIREIIHIIRTMQGTI